MSRSYPPRPPPVPEGGGDHRRLGAAVTQVADGTDVIAAVIRQWTIVEWLLGAALPACLETAGAADLALDLASSSAVRSLRDLVATGSLIEEAARAARQAHDGWRQATASLAGPCASYQVNRPPWRAMPAAIPAASVSAWQGLSEGASAAVDPVDALVEPVTAVLGVGKSGACAASEALRSAPVAVTDCLFAVAWSGCYERVVAGPWSWDTDRSHAAHVGLAAGSRALRPLHERLDHQAHDLTSRLLAVTVPSPGASEDLGTMTARVRNPWRAWRGLP